MKPVLTALCISILALPVCAQIALSPMQALQAPINHVIGILTDPRFEDSATAQDQQREIRKHVDKIFDFKGISRLAVGRYWKRFTPQERATFTALFSELLRRSYISKIQGEFRNEEVAYLEEIKRSVDRYVIKTEIIRATMKIPVDYSMRLKDGHWRVYDVKVEGVSLVKNYRSQFSKILMRGSPETLIKRIEKKVDRLKDAEE